MNDFCYVIFVVWISPPYLTTFYHKKIQKLSTAQGNKEEHGKGVEEKIFSDEELQSLIDPILKTDDASQDGFIDYPEFVRAQQKATEQKEER